jgi:tryptophanyl-tRNA synthetase
MDPTIPQYGILQYDWIISLEVALHIPEKYEAVYLDNILRHAKEGIILSWAVPGQGGISP